MSAATKVDETQWISTARAGRLCGVSGATIRKWIDAGYLEAYRAPGGMIRVDHESVVALLNRWKQR